MVRVDGPARGDDVSTVGDAVTVDDVVAVIPARGGSKSLPRKNIRTLCGHPLIAYSIAAARAAKRVGRVIVTTDDPEIAAIAREYGAEVPYLRPAELAADDTPDLPVFAHLLDWLDAEEGARPEALVHLRPTSPVRPPGLVDHAVELLRSDPAADAVRSVCVPDQNPYKMWRLQGDRLVPLLASEFDEPYDRPRQSLPETLWQTGTVDVVRRATIQRHRSMSGRRVLPLLVGPEYAVDIDSPEEWTYAEWRIGRGDISMIRPGPMSGRGAVTGAVTGAGAGAGAFAGTGRYRAVVFDFDGVFTDNRVYVFEDGRETVACDRADGLGIASLRRAGYEVAVLSTETNGVVSARCRKLGIRCRQGLGDGKAAALRELAAELGIGLEEIVYVGNDRNDTECLRIAGLAVTVADAHPEAVRHARWVLTRPGGRGAVRELCDHLLARQGP